MWLLCANKHCVLNDIVTLVRRCCRAHQHKTPTLGASLSVETRKDPESVWKAHAMQGWRCCGRSQVEVTARHAHQHPRSHICRAGKTCHCTSSSEQICPGMPWEHTAWGCNSGVTVLTVCLYLRYLLLDWQSTYRLAASFPTTGSLLPTEARRRQSCPRHRQSGSHPQIHPAPLHLQSSPLLGTLVSSLSLLHDTLQPSKPRKLFDTAAGFVRSDSCPLDV